MSWIHSILVKLLSSPPAGMQRRRKSRSLFPHATSVYALTSGREQVGKAGAPLFVV
jgi:hypothetical protein